MIDLDKKLGPVSLRIWGLILNFIGNFIALYGAAQFLKENSGPGLMILGIIMTIGCILFLAIPQK